MKSAYIRFEASQSIGAGHAIRCLVLADSLSRNGWNCFIVSSEISYYFIRDLNRYERIDPQLFFHKHDYADLLIIDSYALGYEYESHFRLTIQKIMVIDDIPNRKHNCDILLDQTYARDAVVYKHLVPTNCKLLVGSKYALLRKEFSELRHLAIKKKENLSEVKYILVSMGGGDSNNHAIKILEIIDKAGFLGTIELVLGFCDQDKSYIDNYLKHYRLQVNIHINPNMAELIYKSDIAIGAAGSSMWERCCLGLPTFMITCSDDQLVIAKNLHSANAAINLGTIDHINIDEASSILMNINKDPLQLNELSKNAFAVCDGSGIDRVIKEIFYEY